jgi:hypothetical protein
MEKKKTSSLKNVLRQAREETSKWY